jgi:hypothetical protein
MQIGICTALIIKYYLIKHGSFRPLLKQLAAV